MDNMQVKNSSELLEKEFEFETAEIKMRQMCENKEQKDDFSEIARVDLQLITFLDENVSLGQTAFVLSLTDSDSETENQKASSEMNGLIVNFRDFVKQKNGQPQTNHNIVDELMKFVPTEDMPEQLIIVPISQKIDKYSVNLTDFQRLKPNKWINDAIINAQMALLNAQTETMLFLNTKIWMGLTQSGHYNYAKIRPWTRAQQKTDWKTIFDYEKVIMPCNLQKTHLVLAVINFVDLVLHGFDSIFDENVLSFVLQQIERFVEDEWKNKCYANPQIYKFDPKQWNHNLHPGYQQQQGSNNCGMFLIGSAKAIAVNEMVEGNFTNNDINEMRTKVAYEFCHGKLLL